MSVCAVVGCFNSKRKKTKRFFRVPAIIKKQGSRTLELSTSRRKKWLSRLRRLDLLNDSEARLGHIRVCSDHFVSGAPAVLYDYANPDWVPSLKLGDGTNDDDDKVRKDHQRHVRFEIRRKRRLLEMKAKEEAEAKKKRIANDHIYSGASQQNEVSKCQDKDTNGNDTNLSTQNVTYSNTNNSEVDNKFKNLKFNSVEIQTSEHGDYMDRITMDNTYLQEEVASLRKKISLSSLDIKYFFKNDFKINSYTGFPSWDMFSSFYESLKDTFNEIANLTKFEMLISVLMHLKLNVKPSYLAILFKVSISDIENVFLTVIHALYEKLMKSLIWPDASVLRKSLPLSFRKFCSQNVVLIDFLEINVIEESSHEPEDLDNIDIFQPPKIMRYLIGMTVQRNVIFIQEVCCNVDYINILKNSNLLDKMNAGDNIFSSFPVNSEPPSDFFCANITHMKDEKDVPVTRLALNLDPGKKLDEKIKFHVDRATGCLRRKFGILNISVNENFTVCNPSVICKIVSVCCALNNMWTIKSGQQKA